MTADQQLPLRIALTRPDHPKVKLLGRSVRKISPREALLLAHSGDYEWGGSLRRVRWMRLAKPVAPWLACWRTTKAVTLEPSLEWGRPA